MKDLVLKYRAEIDGLRAVAVVPVILFHAGFEFFSGGFVGVDVFFVISGYLITTILIEDIEKNRFSISSFYERRARRILPALFFLMFICIPFAWMWMVPTQMKDFSQSLVAVGLFASNILFWKESGYFDAVAEEKPLLHTWSLAVEEQYYLLFPIFLFLAWRFGKEKVFWTLVVLAAVSLALSEWGWRNNATANFYLAPTRAWELFSGSIAAFVIQKRGVQANNLLALLGLTAILFSIFFYDEKTPFPSVYALVPVIGVVLLILFADRETFAAKLLSTKGFVGIGLISYSAYLWHQPLFAFAKIRSIGDPGLALMSLLTVASMALAWLSWKFIENPFRRSSHIYNSRNSIFILSVIGILIFSSAGLIGHETNGYAAQRYSNQQLMYLNTGKSSPLRPKCHFSQKVEFLAKTECEYFSEGPAEIAVLGNSHATELAYALAKILEKKNSSILHYTMSGCRHNFKVLDEENTVCHRWHDIVVKKISSKSNIKTVILSYKNDSYLQEKKYRNSLIKISDALISAGKKVVLVLQAPLPGAHIEKYLNYNLRSFPSTVKGNSLANWNHAYHAANSLTEEISGDVIVVDPADYFCENNECLVVKGGKALYFDDDHMSVHGAKIIAQGLVEILNIGW
jgi:peptidoglycan/LPS O-acetylase OafA/YrhL